jgi:hypothetical protein
MNGLPSDVRAGRRMAQPSTSVLISATGAAGMWRLLRSRLGGASAAAIPPGLSISAADPPASAK